MMDLDVAEYERLANGGGPGPVTDASGFNVASIEGAGGVSPGVEGGWRGARPTQYRWWTDAAYMATYPTVRRGAARDVGSDERRCSRARVGGTYNADLLAQPTFRPYSYAAGSSGPARLR